MISKRQLCYHAILIGFDIAFDSYTKHSCGKYRENTSYLKQMTFNGYLAPLSGDGMYINYFLLVFEAKVWSFATISDLI